MIFLGVTKLQTEKNNLHKFTTKSRRIVFTNFIYKKINLEQKTKNFKNCIVAKRINNNNIAFFRLPVLDVCVFAILKTSCAVLNIGKLHLKTIPKKKREYLSLNV